MNLISSGNINNPTIPANNIVTQATSSATNLWAQSVTSAQLNLGPLQNNGGPTQTHSPRVPAVLPSTLAMQPLVMPSPVNGLDQRGINRTTSDIGAYSFGIQVTTTLDTVDPSDNLTSLREAITLANTTPGNDQISVNLTGANPYTITLAGALPNIVSANTSVSGGTAGTVTITGLGASNLNINGNLGGFSIFNIASGGNLFISGVTVIWGTNFWQRRCL